MMDACATALWRYVTRDECDCECRPAPTVAEWVENAPTSPCPDPTHDPCHFCTGFAALDAAGADIAGCGLVEPGLHTASEIARLQAAKEAA